MAVFFVGDGAQPVQAQSQDPSLPSVTAIYADARRAADAAALSTAAARAAARAASALASSHPAAADDAAAARAAANLSDFHSAVANYHADIAADHTTAGSDLHCHPRMRVCHTHLDSEPYARSSEAARSAADAHAQAAAAHAAHARAVLKVGTFTTETMARVAAAAASADAHAAAAAASADAAWDAVHEDDTQTAARHAVTAHASAANAANARAVTAFYTQQKGTMELENQVPTVSRAVPNLTLVNEQQSATASLSGVFSDADNDPLAVTAASSDETKATVSVASDYSSLTVNAQAWGSATITLAADDGRGGIVVDGFTVTLKAAPMVVQTLDDVTGLEEDSTQDVSLAGVFRDADGDTLTFTAASSDETKSTVSVAADGSKLTVAGWPRARQPSR